MLRPTARRRLWNRRSGRANMVEVGMVGLGMIEVGIVGAATETSSRCPERILAARASEAGWSEGEVEEGRPRVAV